MPSGGGEEIQITRASGDTPQESPDGMSLFFIKGWPSAVTVWKASVDEGPETQVLDSVHSEGQFSVEKHGIYFFRTPYQQVVVIYLSTTFPRIGSPRWQPFRAQ
jgi:hypothetical protein